MKRLTLISLAVFGSLLLLYKITPAANLGIEFLLQRGTSENLFGDSTNTFDASTRAQLECSYYPLSAVEIGFAGAHTYYHENTQLSNSLGRLGITLIPLSESSPLLVRLSGNINGILYHNGYSTFDNNYAEGDLTVGFYPFSKMFVRSGITLTSTTYINSETGHKGDLEFYLGTNLTLPLRNSLDLEAGFAKTNFTHKHDIFFVDSIAPGDIFPTPYIDWRLSWVGQEESNLWSFYISPRLSRAIGFKSGLNITYTRRNFQNYGNQLLLGFTTEYLSPWASVWEGQSITAALKSYLIPRTLLQAGIGYWDKAYLKVIDSDLYYYVDAKNHPARKDWQVRYYISLKWPLLTRGGLYFEPDLRLDYTKNRSNELIYGYSNYSVSVGLSIRL